jgi:trans-2-enoyl-CoA reductase
MNYTEEEKKERAEFFVQDLTDAQLEAEYDSRQKDRRNKAATEAVARWEKKIQEIRDNLKRKVQRIKPDVTEEQLDELMDYFSEYESETWH